MSNNRVTYNVTEVAEKLGISVSKCYSLVRKGSIPCVHLDGRYIVPVKAFDEWLESSVRGGVTE